MCDCKHIWIVKQGDAINFGINLSSIKSTKYGE